MLETNQANNSSGVKYNLEIEFLFKIYFVNVKEFAAMFGSG